MDSRLEMAREVLATLDSLGTSIFVKDGKLTFSAADKLDPLLASNCRQLRAELIALITERQADAGITQASSAAMEGALAITQSEEPTAATSSEPIDDATLATCPQCSHRFEARGVFESGRQAGYLAGATDAMEQTRKHPEIVTDSEGTPVKPPAVWCREFSTWQVQRGSSYLWTEERMRQLLTAMVPGDELFNFTKDFVSIGHRDGSISLCSRVAGWQPPQYAMPDKDRLRRLVP